jgi:hypothetical protein
MGEQHRAENGVVPEQTGASHSRKQRKYLHPGKHRVVDRVFSKAADEDFSAECGAGRQGCVSKT